MKILVTGATGQLGSLVVKHLLPEKCKVCLSLIEYNTYAEPETTR